MSPDVLTHGTRLDALLTLRDDINAEIKRERVRAERVRDLTLRASWLNRASYATCVAVATAEHYGIDLDVLLGEARTGEVVEARHIAMYLMREGGYGYSAIGREIDRDHSTVAHGCRKVASDERLKNVASVISGAIERAA